MGSQPDVDRWRQRLVLPPVLWYTHTHAQTHLATSFSQDNYLATCASPHSLTHLHALTLHQLWTLTRNDNRHTHIKTCQAVCIHSHTPQALQQGGRGGYGNCVDEGHSSQLPLCKPHRQSDSQTDRQTDRQTETLSYIFGMEDVFFRCSVCLFAWSQVQFTPSPSPVNSIISDYFLTSAAALIHLLLTYLCCASQPSSW